MSRTLYKWILLIALLAYAALMAVWADMQVSQRPCRGLRIEITPGPDGSKPFLSPKAVERELGDLPANIKGVPLSAINTALLEKRLNAVNNFENAECVITSDGYLLVRVVPIKPEARIFTPTGTYYINRQGKRLDAHAEYYVDLPVVRGNFDSRMPAALALPMVRFVQNDSLLHSLVSMIDFRSPDNIILIPRIRGHVINMGDTTRLAEKTAALLRFYKGVMPHKGWAFYDTVSVKFRGQVVATRTNKAAKMHSTLFDDPDPDPEEQSALDQTTIAEEPVKAPEPDPAEKKRPDKKEKTEKPNP